MAEAQVIKGTPVRLFSAATAAKLSDNYVDMQGFNALSIQVIVTGATPQADITVKGADQPGASGSYLTLPDAKATQAAVSASLIFDVICGQPFARVDLGNLSGTFAAGQGFTVIATPYVAAGQTSISVTNTASQNLAQVGGAAVSLGQKAMASSLPVVLPNNQTLDTELPAAAALSDATANPTAPQVGAASERWNGATWERVRVATVFKNVAAVAVTAATPVDLWTPVAGKKFRVLGYSLSLSVAGSVILKDDTTEILRTPLMAAGIGQSSPPMGNGILSAAANNKLKIDVTASGDVSGYVFGTEE